MPAKNITINLLGDSEMEHTPVGRIVTWAVTYGRYIMIGTEIVVLLAFISRFSLDRRLTDLKEEVSQKQAIIEANIEFEQEYKMIQDRIGKIKALWASGSNPLDVIVLFQNILPQDVYLNNLDIQNGKLTVEAIAATSQGFAQFIANLRSVKELRNIEIGSVKRDPLVGIQFTFSAQYGQPKSPTPAVAPGAPAADL